MCMYKIPTDAKKLELSLGVPEHVQKRRPLYAYFANEAGLLPNPVFHPEIEPKKQEDFMEPQPLVGMEEEPVYADMATEGPSVDSNVENQLIDPGSWKDGDVVTGKATEAHDEESATGTGGAFVGDDDSESDEGTIEVA
ncbi:Myotubularin-related protein 5 [Platysternon megacephalum]|uniref:Myotubularin-related protein 5 n=1 Tax=Platysternon megacephalum TaxID=55544 RepID=A0A4D9DF92_9SAUR|nr:Myotubularin-related protein 5 [Platysternon megacephalum]